MYNIPSFSTWCTHKTIGDKISLIWFSMSFAVEGDGHFAVGLGSILQKRIFIMSLALNDGLDGSLQFSRVKSSLDLSPQCDAMLDFLEYGVRETGIGIDAGINIHPEPSQHNRNQADNLSIFTFHYSLAVIPSSTCTSNHIKVFARFWR